MILTHAVSFHPLSGAMFVTLDIQIPAEVWCFRYVFGVQIPNLRRWPWMSRVSFQEGYIIFISRVGYFTPVKPIYFQPFIGVYRVILPQQNLLAKNSRRAQRSWVPSSITCWARKAPGGDADSGEIPR